MHMTPLGADQTEAYLQALFDQAGVTPTAPDVRLAWDVFKDFARVPVLC